MSTIIDALILQLELDPSNFSKGQKQAASDFLKTRDTAQKTAKEIEDAGKRAAEFFSALRREVIGLFAAFTAGRGLKEFIADITASDAALGRMAQNLNQAPGTLSTWRQAVQRLGGSAESAQNSFQSLSDSINELKTTGNTGILPWLYKLQAAGGVQFNFAKPIEKQLLDVAEALHNVARTDPTMANFLGRRLGLDQGTVNFLIQGRAAVQAQLKEQERLGKATEESTKAATELQKAWADLSSSATDLGRVLLVNVAPGIVFVLNKFKEFFQYLRDIQKKPILNVDEFKKQFDDMISAIKNAGSRILAAFKEAFKPGLDWIKNRINEVWRAVTGHDLFAAESYSAVRERMMSQGAGAAARGSAGTLSPQRGITPPRAQPGAIRSDEAGRGSARAGIGQRAARGALAANQREAYQAAREAGLSETAAKALVANMTGESLANPRDHHWDRSHMSQGIVQWDPQRAEAIKRQFGKYPKDMSVAEQTRASIWEINNNPRFRQTRDALRGGGSPQEMINALVRNYEVPANPGGEVAKRVGHYNALGDLAKNSALTPSSVPYFAQSNLGAPGVAGISNDNRSNSYNSSNNTKVGNVNVYMPSGANAVDVARDIGPAIERNAFVAHANGGPN